jgi:radical SAM protein with 4Fe4S-binding SPASM domain
MAVRQDFGNLRTVSQSLLPINPGLYHYNFNSDGGRSRIHLRIAEDLSGVLFIDVSDVIHLNSTAAEMAWLALGGMPEVSAQGLLNRRYARPYRDVLAKDLHRIYEMVGAFGRNGNGCPTCEINGLEFEEAALFSIPTIAPYKADIALTYGCNNQCAHCYNIPERYPMPSLPFESWIKVINRLHKIGIPHLIFTGGEATLHPLLPQLIQHAESKGMVTGLNTNGRRLAFVPYVEELSKAGLNHVQVTLASRHAQLHDQVMGAKAYNQTVKGIRNTLAAGLHVITNTTITGRNCEEVEGLVEFLSSLGIRTFAMNGMIHSGGGLYNPDALAPEELAPVLIRVRDKARELGLRFLWYTPTEYCKLSPVELEIGAKRCNAGEYSICIEPNGDVLPCQSFYVSAGNILRDPWTSIWRGDLFQSFRQREAYPELNGLPEKCWTCPDLQLCGGGCRIEREATDAARLFQTACPSGNHLAHDGGYPGNSPSGFSYIPLTGVAQGNGRGSGRRQRILLDE